MRHELLILDGSVPEDALPAVVHHEVRQYRVLADAGLFKRGQHWPKDSAIELERSTGDRFVAAGEAEEIPS